MKRETLDKLDVGVSVAAIVAYGSLIVMNALRIKRLFNKR